MDSKLNNSYTQFSWIDSIGKSNNIDSFINWLSGEFILYQQEDIQGIKVYFPNWWFVVHSLEEKDNTYKFIINYKSKYAFIKIKNQLSLAIHRFKSY
jgi:hypothetical protein